MAEKIGEIDLDTLKAQYSIEMFNRKVERMQKVVAGADKQMSAWQRSWNALSRVAGAFGVVLGVQGIMNYIASLRNLGEEVNRTRAGLIAGSRAAQDFEKTIGGFGDAQEAEINDMARGWDNFWLGVKVKTARGLSDFAKAWKQGRVSIFGVAPESGKSPSPPDLEDKPTSSRRDLLAIEDEIARLQETQTAGIEDQLAIMRKQIELEEKRAEVAMKTNDLNARKIVNDASAAIGILRMRTREMERQRDLQTKGAEAELTAMEQIRDGQSANAELTRIRAKYEAQISQALKEQNTQLASILRQQQRIEEQEAKRKAHTMTPRERVAERREARRRNREIRQAEAAEQEFQERWNRGIRPVTPGSEFDNWAKRQGAMNGANVPGKPAQASGMTGEQIATAMTHLATIAAAFTADTK